MAKINPYLIFLGLLFNSFNSHAAGFDCTKASAWVEKEICSNHELSQLDDQLSLSYQNTLFISDNKTGLKKEQSNWLASVRNACKNAACLQKAYTSRISELDKLTATNPKPQSVSGKYQRYFHGKPDDSANITVTEKQDGQIQISGTSVWVGDKDRGYVNDGELEGSFPIDHNRVHYTDGEENGCRLTITFGQDGLVVSDDNLHCGGLNVTFDGQYRKAGDTN